MIGGAEGAGNIAVEQLPVRLLGVAEPQRIFACRGGACQQARCNLGTRRQLQPHLVLLIGLLSGIAARGRIRLLVDFVRRHHRNGQGAVASKVERAAVRAGLQLVVTRQLAIARVPAASVGSGGWQCQALSLIRAASIGHGGGCMLGGGFGAAGRWRAPACGGWGCQWLLVLGPGIKAGQAGFVVCRCCALAPALFWRWQLRFSGHCGCCTAKAGEGEGQRQRLEQRVRRVGRHGGEKGVQMTKSSRLLLNHEVLGGIVFRGAKTAANFPAAAGRAGLSQPGAGDVRAICTFFQCDCSVVEVADHGVR